MYSVGYLSGFQHAPHTLYVVETRSSTPQRHRVRSRGNESWTSDIALGFVGAWVDQEAD